MTFAFRFNEPGVLLLLWGVIALAIVAYLALRRSQRLRLLFTRQAATLAPVDWVRRSLRAGLLLAALALVVFALARPSWSSRRVTVQQRGRDVAFVVDVSRSMMAEDMVPNRLERAKLAILDAIPQLEGDRVAVVAFAGSTRVIAPLTRDYHFVRWAVESLSPASVDRGGSLVGDAVRVTAEDVFDPLVRRRKDVIILTDGEDQGSYPVEAAAAAGREGVRVVAVGLGSRGQGTRIPVVTEEGERRFLTSGGREVYSRLEAETLRDMAGATPNGRYLGVGTGAFDLGQIYRDLILSEEAFSMGEVDIVQYEERFQIFLLAAFLLLVGEGLLRDRKNPPARGPRLGEGRASSGAARSVVLLLAVLTLPILAARAGGVSETVEEGNAALEADALQEALNLYERARELAPDEPVPLYNLGVALYESENYPAALNAFQNMRTDRPQLALLSHYNQGNTLARLGNGLERQEPGQALELYRRSIGAYKRALAIDPEHVNARRNIEVVRQWIEPLLERQGGSDGDGQQSDRSSEQRQEGPQSDSQDGSPSPGDPGDQSPEESPDQSEAAPEADLDTEDSPAESAEAILEEEEQRRREQAEAAGRRDAGGSPTW